MINLLAKDTKKDFTYARRNTLLLRWAAVLLISLAGVMAIVLAGHLYMNRQINVYSKQLDKNRQALKVSDLDQTQKRLEDISSSLKLVVQVLSKEVLFSKLLRQLGSALPQGTVLLQLQIDKIQGGLTLRAGATNIDAATQLQVNLQDPNNQIFDKADIENINCLPSDPTVKYPCTVQLKVLFAKNNPFLFINSSSGASP